MLLQKIHEMVEIEDLEEQFKINPGSVNFSKLDLDFKLGETKIEILEKQKVTVEIYDPRSGKQSSSLF